ncbi:MAG: hypothetical protein NTY66_02805 [Candidatus Vogelbacteria bacterium]|nr:hypothetical protein [Candidatus Vogelbacteria bacterium]
MAEQLHGLGLISDRKLSLEKAREELAASQCSIPEPTVGDLDACRTMDQWNALAKVILLDDPSHLAEIIKKANRWKNPNSPRCKHFIWGWYQICERIKDIPAEKLPIFLDRALRRHNPTFEIPV